MGRRELAKDYLTFTRKERIGLLVVVLLILLIWILPKAIPVRNLQNSTADTSWLIAARKLMVRPDSFNKDRGANEQSLDEVAYDNSANHNGKKSAGELFYFDPNTLSPAGWKKLGLPGKTITTIQKYLSKGGHFYRAGDLEKIYSIHADEFARLAPFIKIEVPLEHGDSKHYHERNESKKPRSPRYSVVDVNTADTSEFIALPGIGSKLALRIVNFRDKLGGFYTIDQLSETYGLPDSVFRNIRQFLKLENGDVKKININTATKDEMKSHPYIKWNLANAIVEYRNQHGSFSSTEDLKKISIISDADLSKMKPYISVQ